MSCASKERGDWDFVLPVCCVSLVELGKNPPLGMEGECGCPYLPLSVHPWKYSPCWGQSRCTVPSPALSQEGLALPKGELGHGRSCGSSLGGSPGRAPGGSSSLRDGRCCWSWCGTSSSPALLPLLPAVSAAFPPAGHRESDAGHRRELGWQWSTRSCALLTLEEFQSRSRDSAVGIGSSCRSVLWEVGYARQPLRLSTALIPQEPSTLQLPGREPLARETHGKQEITSS